MRNSLFGALLGLGRSFLTLEIAHAPDATAQARRCMQHLP
jgi:hypothetical protein